MDRTNSLKVEIFLYEKYMPRIFIKQLVSAFTKMTKCITNIIIILARLSVNGDRIVTYHRKLLGLFLDPEYFFPDPGEK